jgi:hypothetical protein
VPAHGVGGSNEIEFAAEPGNERLLRIGQVDFQPGLVRKPFQDVEVGAGQQPRGSRVDAHCAVGGHDVGFAAGLGSKGRPVFTRPSIAATT